MAIKLDINFRDSNLFGYWEGGDEFCLKFRNLQQVD